MEVNRKRAKVHMLPTKDKSKIFMVGTDIIYSALNEKGKDRVHLYITTDEEIKKGDWYMGIDNKPHKAVDGLHLLVNVKKLPKIIATTDADINNSGLQNGKLYMVGVEGTKFEDLRPKQIPQHIIEAYVKKPFDEVEVEYEIKKGLTRITMTPYNKGIKPKLNQDGTLAVSLIREKMYSNESRKQLIRDFHQIVDDTWDEEDVEKWIKENL